MYYFILFFIFFGGGGFDGPSFDGPPETVTSTIAKEILTCEKQSHTVSVYPSQTDGH